MMQRYRTQSVVVAALVLIGASFSLGVFYGYNSSPEIERVENVISKTTPSTLAKEVDFEPFWKAWRILEAKHIGEKEIDRQALVWGAIEGMVKSLGDPYTTFFPPKDLEDFETEIRGEFSGIGAEIGMRKDVLTLIAPIKGSPSEKAGLKAGDKILKINDSFTSDLTLDEAVHQIRGERGTQVKLIILRNGEEKPREISVARDVIKVPILTTESKNGVFIIRLASFSEKSSLEFAEAVREMLNSGNKKLIVDLRNNPGGFFTSAVEIASWFLPEGEVVAQEEYRDRESDIYRSVGYRALENIPTVILVNRGSASASEILAGALQEHKKATLIGEKTFGKGTVQELEEITPSTSIKVTIAKWLTPSGKSITKEGLTPDITVEIPENLEPGSDPQLEKAFEYLKTR
ncbi:MAG: S41 family peptidase [Patescibacteria group bacterium]